MAEKDLDDLLYFLAAHQDRPDGYEIWGQGDRPKNVITMGSLRRLYQMAHKVIV